MNILEGPWQQGGRQGTETVAKIYMIMIYNHESERERLRMAWAFKSPSLPPGTYVLQQEHTS